MAIAAAVKKFLDGHGIHYQVSSHARTNTLEEAAQALGISTHQIARSVLLRDELGVVMAVLPVTHRLDFKRLKKLLQRDLQAVSGREADKIFTDCEPGSRPPVAEAYGMACVVDTSLTVCEDIYFEPGAHNSLVHVSRHEFQDMLSTALKGQFAYPTSASSVVLDCAGASHSAMACFAEDTPYLNVECLQRCINDRYKLPNIPLLFELIGSLQAQTPLPVRDEIITALTAVPTMQDILLTNANVLQPTAGERTFKDLHQLLAPEQDLAIIRSSLGLAVGVLAAQAFHSPVTGPFSNKIIWRHGLHAAILAEQVAKLLQPKWAISPAEAYLAALLQNVGVLLLGYLFPPEYHLLNRLGLAHPDMSMDVIERKMLGMGKAHDLIALGHERLGAWLLKSWQFPESTCLVAAEHHNPLLNQDANPYLLIVMLVNSLLSEHGYVQLVQRGNLDAYLRAFDLKPQQLEPLEQHLARIRPALERMLQQV